MRRGQNSFVRRWRSRLVLLGNLELQRDLIWMRNLRKGMGTQLVRHAEAALERLGCPKLNLQVRADNRDVVAFYQSLGFDSEERISMGKRLSTNT